MDLMNLQQYRQMRARLEDETPKLRELCRSCLQPGANCFCRSIRAFDPSIKFVILTHPIEVRRRIATGRMSHLGLVHSEWLMGQDFSLDPTVNRLLRDPDNVCVTLYPGRVSRDLTAMDAGERAELFPSDKRLVVFVIDGTWSTARKMIRSRNLVDLPRICFTPPTQSNFRVRKQPKENCYSTVEAIHHTIELLGPGRGFDTASRRHDALLEVFSEMVERQLEYIRASHRVNVFSRHRKSEMKTG